MSVCMYVRTNMATKRGGVKNSNFFYTNLPIEMGEVIDKIVAAKGAGLAIFNRQDYIKHALREQIKKDLEAGM